MAPRRAEQQQAGHARSAHGQHRPGHHHHRPRLQPALQHQPRFETGVAEQGRRTGGQRSQRQQQGEATQHPLHVAPAQQARHQRRQGQAEHRQRRQDVDIALAVRKGEEQHDQQPPGQRQQVARITPPQPPTPRRDRPRQGQERRDPHRRHRAQEVPPRLVVVPRLHVALGGLPEQDVVEVGLVLARFRRQRGHHHRHQPQRDGQHEGQRRQPEAQVTRMQAHPRPVQCRGDRRRQDHQQREHAHALGDDPDAGEEPAGPPPAPGRPQQQVAQQPVVGQRDEQHHQRVDLRLLGLEGELQREQQRPAGVQADPARPQPPAQVDHAPERAQRGDQRGQQEGHPPVADHAVQGGLPPHQHGRLVRIQLQPPMREQPLAAVHHLLGDQGETRLVRWPGVAQSEPRTQHQQGHHYEQPRLA